MKSMITAITNRIWTMPPIVFAVIIPRSQRKIKTIAKVYSTQAPRVRNDLGYLKWIQQALRSGYSFVTGFFLTVNKLLDVLFIQRLVTNKFVVARFEPKVFLCFKMPLFVRIGLFEGILWMSYSHFWECSPMLRMNLY